jgi:restriction system protein
MSKIKKILNILFEKEEEIKFNPTGNNYKKKEQYIPTLKKLEDKKEKNSKGYNYGNIKKTKEKDFLTVTEVAKHFKIEASELNNIFSNLKWAIKEDRWWIASEIGIKLGAKQEYNTKSKVKYIKWDKSIKGNFELIQSVNNFKNHKPIKKYTNVEKGYLYEKYIAEHYTRLGYFVWEHGKEKGRLDQGIDLIVKKDKEIIFIQCKNWKQNTRFKIDHVRIKASRAEARQFMLNNPLFKGYNNKFRYTISNDCMHPSAIKYIEENNGLFDYEVIEMN